MFGEDLLSTSELTALADLPPRDVLLARLAGGIAAPLQQLAGLLQALPRNLAYGISALIETMPPAEPSTPPPPFEVAEAPEPADTAEPASENEPVAEASEPEAADPEAVVEPTETAEAAPAEETTDTTEVEETEETKEQSENG
jgi:large subunit ribosomal protein L10